ncbi:hypothetical protein Tsubulata_011147 [Turnera subulata]|uniref:LysM domain-containing protein n=1 Tax=Turnera subulata TaxID=218843 RepID=A0A9Q0FVC7_9ROSI|nr:hypothetical protein Tsubulata_011147 [Turnera subulata]
MAKSSTKTAFLLNLVLMVSVLLAFSLVESRLFGIGFPKSSPTCFSVYGVQSGDTCFAVEQSFNLTTEAFNAINPNLECKKLFVGQWLCVSGSA